LTALSNGAIAYPTTFDTVVILERGECEPASHFNPHSSPILYLAALKRFLFCGTADGYMSLWYSPNIKPQTQNQQMEPPVDQCFTLSDGRILTASSHGGKVSLWSTAGDSQEIYGPCYPLDSDDGSRALGYDSVVIFTNGDVLSVVE
jgi:hypothetical protein